MSDKIVKNASILFVLMFISKALGILREIALAHYYGASAISDAYILATSSYTMIFAALSTAITVAYIKYISHNNTKIIEITTKLTILTSLFVLIVSILICIFPNIYVQLLASGLDNKTTAIVTQMVRIIMPFSFLICARHVLSAFLQTKNNFFMSPISTILVNIFIIIAIVFSNSNYIILASGDSIGAIFCFFLTIVIIKKNGLKLQKINLLKISDIKPIISLMIPLFLGQLIQQFNIIVDKNFASLVGEGIISSINYANKINSLFATFFVASITTVLFPSLSKLSTNNKLEFSKLTAKSGKIILMVAIPVSLGILLLSETLISVLYMRGAFTKDDLQVTAQILMIYSLGIPALSISDLLNKQFYAMGNTKTPVILSIVSLAINIVLNFIWVHYLGYIGLALSTTISVILLQILLHNRFEKIYKLRDNMYTVQNYKPILLSSATMGIVIVVALFLTQSLADIFILAICGVLGIISYTFALLIFKEEEATSIKDKLLKRIRK